MISIRHQYRPIVRGRSWGVTRRQVDADVIETPLIEPMVNEIGSSQTGRANGIWRSKVAIGSKPNRHYFSSSNLRRIYRHCPAVPSEEPPKPCSSLEAVPNVRPSTHTEHCAKSNSREAKRAASMVGPVQLPAATQAELG
jgi:hypothetical protein